jgi:hypothetical protein
MVSFRNFELVPLSQTSKTMRIRDIVAISGMGGLFKVEGQKVNGLIVTSLAEGWTKFVSNRTNMFSPLDNISIYTDTDNIELADVLLLINDKKEAQPLPDTNADSAALRNWFIDILPNHDQEKVYVSDIKKMVKWFHILAEHNIIEDEIKGRAEEKAAEEENTTEEEVIASKKDTPTE